jgi:hypothetical protein
MSCRLSCLPDLIQFAHLSADVWYSLNAALRSNLSLRGSDIIPGLLFERTTLFRPDAERRRVDTIPKRPGSLNPIFVKRFSHRFRCAP